MIKPMQNTTSAVQQALPSVLLHTHPSTLRTSPTSRAAAAAIIAAPDTVLENSTPHQWQAYANGGVKTDDAKAWQKQRKEAAKFQELISNGSSASSSLPPGKLIQMSPEKKIPQLSSANTNLLIDLVDDGLPTATAAPSTPCKSRFGRTSYKEKFSYIGEMTSPISEKEKAGELAPAPVFNLLD